MEVKKFVKSFAIILLAIIGVVGLNFTVVQGLPFLEMFFGRSGLNTIYGLNNELYPNYSGMALSGLFEFVALYILIKDNKKIEDKRLKVFSLVLSVILALFEIFGTSIALYKTIKVVFDYIILYTIKFCGILVVIYNLVLAIFSRILKFEKKEIDEKSYFTANLKSFFIVLGILFLAWLPYYLQHFPGVLNYDSNSEIHQILGDEKLTNYNPIVHVGFLALSIIIGSLFGTISAGVIINVILQFIIVGIACSFTIYYLAKKKVDVRIRMACLLFFAFFPAIPIINVIVHKDTIFSAFMLFSMIAFYELLTNHKSLFKSKLRTILFVLIFVLTALARRNALYVLLASAIFMFLYVFVKKEIYKGYVAKIACLLIVSMVISYGGNKIVSNYTRVENSWKKYIPAQYNIMIQQLLRVTLDHKDELSREDLKLVENLYAEREKETMEDCYTPYLTDNAMKQGDSVFFKEHKDEIMDLYYKLMFKYPISYIDSIFCTTSGYWEIEGTRYSLWTDMYPNDFGVESSPVHQFYIINFIERIIVFQNIPLLGLLYSTGLPFWILLCLVFFNLYKKNYRLSLWLIPIILYFATLFLGPLNGEMRYIFVIYMCLPLVIALTFHNMGTKE